MKDCLFDDKTMYLQMHDSHCSLASRPCISKHYKRLKEQDNLHLIDGLHFTIPNTFAQLAPYYGPCEFEIVPFCKRNSYGGFGQAVHFFQYDYTFSTVWNELDRTVCGLGKFDAVFTPDFSLYVDVPDHINKNAIYKSRFVGAYMQKCGYNVIPTFSWGNATSFNYCLEGLPEGGVMATCGVGVNTCSASFSLWCYGMRRVEEEKKPDLVYVYGPQCDIPGFTTELRFIPTQMQQFHKK